MFCLERLCNIVTQHKDNENDTLADVWPPVCALLEQLITNKPQYSFFEERIVTVSLSLVMTLVEKV